MSTQYLPYINIGTNYIDSKPITTDKMCNAITFSNEGVSVATINPINKQLQQGQSIVIGGNIGEVDTTQYSVVFDNSGSTKNLLVIQKLYK